MQEQTKPDLGAFESVTVSRIVYEWMTPTETAFGGFTLWTV